VVSKAKGFNPFRTFEELVIRLYDGGVLSPAVLERVIGAFAQTDTDWHAAPRSRSVDGRSLHEIVAMTMLPGEPLRSASTSFGSVIEHIEAAASRTADADADADASTEPAQPKRTRRKSAAPAAEEAQSDELLKQLAGTESSGKGRRSAAQSRPAAASGYNPFVNARPPRSK
jgi:hypothetical protein